MLSLPSVQAQSAVVALDGGSIKAYSTAGRPLWTFSAKGKLSPYVSRSREGSTYFSRTNGMFFTINRVGRELWRRDLGSPLKGFVVTGWDGRLFIPVDKKIFCYTASGNLLWTITLDNPFSITPKPDRSGGIIFSLTNNDVYRVTHLGRAAKWSLSKPPVVIVSTAAARTQVIAFYKDGTIEDINAPPKDKNQSANKDDDFPKLPAPPIAAIERGGNIAVTMNDGRIALLSTAKKEIVWLSDSHIREMFKKGGKPELEAEMLFDERGVFVLSKNGATSFLADGRRLWFTNLRNAAAIPAFGNDGVLYSGGKDWILYSYKIEDRVRPEQNALYGPIPEGSYGMGRPLSPEKNDIPLSETERKQYIDQITQGINSGRIGGFERDWTSFLLTVSAGQDHITMRIAAIRLLGKIGSQETLPWLVNIFKNDNDPLIRSEAVKAIGNIGVDPQGVAIQAFWQGIIYDGTVKNNDQILTSIAFATGALCRFSGPPLSETGIKILNIIISKEQPPPAQRQAKKELDSLN